MRRRITLVICVIGLLVLLAPSTLAARNVIHYQLTFSEDSVMAMDPTIEDCVGYSGTILEIRNYDIRVTEFVDGPRAGIVHLTGAVYGEFIIEPEPSSPGVVYQGSYREKITFMGTSLDDPIVFSFSLPASATGEDSSTLKFLLHGHGVIGPDDEPRNLVFKFRCIQSTT